jgi:hypothetical protein
VTTVEEVTHRTRRALALADAWRAYAAPADGVEANPFDVLRMAREADVEGEWHDVWHLSGIGGRPPRLAELTVATCLAVLEHDVRHATSVTTGEAVGLPTNFVVACRCGWSCNVATDRHVVAVEVGLRHEQERNQ